jgi:hypothetical protein
MVEAYLNCDRNEIFTQKFGHKTSSKRSLGRHRNILKDNFKNDLRK